LQILKHHRRCLSYGRVFFAKIYLVGVFCNILIHHLVNYSQNNKIQKHHYYEIHFQKYHLAYSTMIKRQSAHKSGFRKWNVFLNFFRCKVVTESSTDTKDHGHEIGRHIKSFSYVGYITISINILLVGPGRA
jgi:hypothetical protein